MADIKIYSPTGEMVGINRFDDTSKVAKHNLISCSESQANNSLAVTVDENGFVAVIDNRKVKIELT